MRVVNLKDQGVFYGPEPDDGCYGNGFYAWNILHADNIEQITEHHRQSISVNSDTFPAQTLIMPLQINAGHCAHIDGLESYPCLFYNNGRDPNEPKFTPIKDLSVYTCDYSVVQEGRHTLSICLGLMSGSEVTERVYIDLGNMSHRLVNTPGDYLHLFKNSAPKFYASVYADESHDPPSIHIQPMDAGWSLLFNENWQTIKKCYGKRYVKPRIMTRGKIDVLEILRYLVKLGWVSENAYVPYTQFGAKASHGPLPAFGYLSICHLDINCK